MGKGRGSAEIKIVPSESKLSYSEQALLDHFLDIEERREPVSYPKPGLMPFFVGFLRRGHLKDVSLESRKGKLETHTLIRIFPDRGVDLVYGYGKSQNFNIVNDGNTFVIDANTSTLPQKLTERTFQGALDELMSLGLAERAIEALGLDVTAEEIVRINKERGGFQQGRAKDLMRLSAFYLHSKNNDLHMAIDGYDEYMNKVYLTASLGKKFNRAKNKLVKLDRKNWAAFAAVLVAKGASFDEVVDRLKISDKKYAKSGKSSQDLVREWSDILQEDGDFGKSLNSIISKSRLFGRMIFADYSKTRFEELGDGMQRAYNINKKRVLSEILLMHILMLTPQDEKATEIKRMSDVDLYGVLDNVFAPYFVEQADSE